MSYDPLRKLEESYDSQRMYCPVHDHHHHRSLVDLKKQLKPTRKASIAVIFLILTINVAICTWIVWASVKIHLFDREFSERNCFPCHEMTSNNNNNHNDDNQFVRKVGDLCCYNSEFQYQKALVAKYARHYGFDKMSSNRCSAHLFLNSQGKDSVKDDTEYTLVDGWTYRMFGGHIVNECLEFQTNGVEIMSSGYYLVYSHLAFVPPVDAKVNYQKDLLGKEAFVLGQQIRSDDEILLKQSEISWFHWYPDQKDGPNGDGVQNVHTPSSYFGCGENRGSFYTSNLFGMVYLKEGSFLKVLSTPGSWLCRTKKASYFGLIKLF